jgi:O-antigen/teichoic acid export membrane protein
VKPALRNTLSVAGADAASRLIGFVVTVYLGRVLGASAFGLLGIGFAVLGYVVLFSSPGVQVIGTRDVAAGTGAELVADVNSLRLILAALLTTMIAAWCVWLVREPEARLVIVIVSASALPLALSPDWFFQGKEQLFPVSVSKVLMYGVYLIVALWLVHSAGDVDLAAVAFTAGNLAATVVLLALLRRSHGTLSLRWSWSSWRTLVVRSYPLGVSSFLTQTVTNLPILIVGIFLTTGDAGAFNAAMKLVFFVLIVDRVFYAVFLPAVSRHGSEAGEPFRRMVFLGLKIVLLVTMPVVLIGIALATPIIALVFGPEYPEAVPVLQYLLPYVPFTLANTVVMTALIAVHRQRDYMVVMSWGTALLTCLCVVLTAIVGIEGTAMSLPLGEAVMTVAFLMAGRRSLGDGLPRALMPALESAIVMSVVMVALHSLPWYATVPIALLGFGATALLRGGLNRDDVRFLRERFV